jgi:hypothetical protein
MGLFDFFSNTYIDSNGYKRYKSNNQPVHREVAAKKLGRELRKKEVVHHKDRNKTNNNPNNLWVYPSQKAHDKVHKEDAKKYGWRASYIGFLKRKK